MKMRSIVFLFVFSLTPALLAKTNQPSVDIRVRDVLSKKVAGYTYRAILGYDEIYPFVIIEQVRNTATRVDQSFIAKTWDISELPGAASVFPLRKGEGLGNLKWKDMHLQFDAIKAKKKKQCKVTGIIQGNPAVDCSKSIKLGD